jgi:hypothetical protein
VSSALEENRRPLLPDSDAADGECKPLPEREKAPLMLMGVLPAVEIRLGGPGGAAGVCIFLEPSLTIKSSLSFWVTIWKARYLPSTTPLLHTSLRLAVLASAPPNLIPQSLTGAPRGAIEGVYVPTILSSFLSQEKNWL